MRYKATMESNKTNSNDKFLMAALLAYLLFFSLMVIAISCKAHCFVDDNLSYILANNIVNKEISLKSIHCTQPAQKQYTPPKLYFDCILAPNTDRQLNYRQVIKNQLNDTHPPLYYIILHTICSFSPGHYSKWFAGAINIIFALLTLFVLRRLIRILTDDGFILTAITYSFVLSSTIINSVACLRMYIMAMFCTTLYTYILVRGTKNRTDGKFYATLFLATLLGTLTHYYCAMYFAFSCALFALYLLHDRRYKELTLFCLTAVAAVAAAYALFPGMAGQIVQGQRGAAAVSDLLYRKDFWHRLKLAVPFINELFGGLLAPVAAAALILAACCKKRGFDSDCSQNIRCCGLIFLPVTAFILTVAKTMPLGEFSYEHIRYFTPVFALLLCGVMLIVFIMVRQCLSRKTSARAITLISAAIITANFLNTDWSGAWLYRGYLKDPYIKICEDTDFVHIGTNNLFYIYEALPCKSLTLFASAQEAQKSELFRALTEKNRLIIGISSFETTSAKTADGTINSLLESVGKTGKYSIIRMPYFYGATHFGENGQKGYKYYLEKQITD